MAVFSGTLRAPKGRTRGSSVWQKKVPLMKSIPSVPSLVKWVRHNTISSVSGVATSLLQSVGAVADEAGVVVVQTIIVKRFWVDKMLDFILRFLAMA